MSSPVHQDHQLGSFQGRSTPGPNARKNASNVNGNAPNAQALTTSTTPSTAGVSVGSPAAVPVIAHVAAAAGAGAMVINDLEASQELQASQSPMVPSVLPAPPHMQPVYYVSASHLPQFQQHQLLPPQLSHTSPQLQYQQHRGVYAASMQHLVPQPVYVVPGPNAPEKSGSSNVPVTTSAATGKAMASVQQLSTPTVHYVSLPASNIIGANTLHHQFAASASTYYEGPAASVPSQYHASYHPHYHQQLSQRDSGSHSQSQPPRFVQVVPQSKESQDVSTSDTQQSSQVQAQGAVYFLDPATGYLFPAAPLQAMQSTPAQPVHLGSSQALGLSPTPVVTHAKGIRYIPGAHSPEDLQTMAPAGAPPCFFFFRSPGGCLKGRSCMFDHTHPPPDLVAHDQPSAGAKSSEPMPDEEKHPSSEPSSAVAAASKVDHVTQNGDNDATAECHGSPKFPGVVPAPAQLQYYILNHVHYAGSQWFPDHRFTKSSGQASHQGAHPSTSTLDSAAVEKGVSESVTDSSVSHNQTIVGQANLQPAPQVASSISDETKAAESRSKQVGASGAKYDRNARADHPEQLNVVADSWYANLPLHQVVAKSPHEYRGNRRAPITITRSTNSYSLFSAPGQSLRRMPLPHQNPDAWRELQRVISPFVEPLVGGQGSVPNTRAEFLLFAHGLYAKASAAVDSQKEAGQAPVVFLAEFLLQCARRKALGLVPTEDAIDLVTQANAATPWRKSNVKESLSSFMTKCSLFVPEGGDARASDRDRDDWSMLAADLALVNVASLLSDVEHCTLTQQFTENNAGISPSSSNTQSAASTNGVSSALAPGGSASNSVTGAPLHHPWSQLHPTSSHLDFSSLLNEITPLFGESIDADKMKAQLGSFSKRLGAPVYDPAYISALRLCVKQSTCASRPASIDAEKLLATVSLPSAYPLLGGQDSHRIFRNRRLTSSASLLTSEPKFSLGASRSNSPNDLLPSWVKYSAFPAVVLNEALFTLMYLRLNATQHDISICNSFSSPEGGGDTLTALLLALTPQPECPILDSRIPTLKNVVHWFVMKHITELGIDELTMDRLHQFQHELADHAFDLVCMAISEYLAAKAMERLATEMNTQPQQRLPLGGFMLFLTQLHPRARALCMRRTLPFVLSQVLLLSSLFPLPLHHAPSTISAASTNASKASLFQTDSQHGAKAQSLAFTREQLLALLSAQVLNLLPPTRLGDQVEAYSFGMELFSLGCKEGYTKLRSIVMPRIMNSSHANHSLLLRLPILALVCGPDDSRSTSVAQQLARISLLLHYFERARATTIQVTPTAHDQDEISEYTLSQASWLDSDAMDDEPDEEDREDRKSDEPEETAGTEGEAYLADVPPRPISIPASGMRGAGALIALTKVYQKWQASMMTGSSCMPAWLPIILQHVVKTWVLDTDSATSSMTKRRILTSNPLWAPFASEVVRALSDSRSASPEIPSSKDDTNAQRGAAQKPSSIPLAILTAFVFAVGAEHAPTQAESTESKEPAHPLSFASLFPSPSLPKLTPLQLSPSNSGHVNLGESDRALNTTKQEKRRLRQARVAAAAARHYLYNAPTSYRAPSSAHSLRLQTTLMPTQSSTGVCVWDRHTKSALPADTRAQSKLSPETYQPVIEFECQFIPRSLLETREQSCESASFSELTYDDIEEADYLLQGLPISLRPSPILSEDGIGSKPHVSATPAPQRLLDFAIQYAPSNSLMPIAIPEGTRVSEPEADSKESQIDTSSDCNVVHPVLGVSARSLRKQTRFVGTTQLRSCDAPGWSPLTCDMSLFFQPEALALFTLLPSSVREQSDFKVQVKVIGAEFFARPSLAAEALETQHGWWKTVASVANQIRFMDGSSSLARSTSVSVARPAIHSVPSWFTSRSLHLVNPQILLSLLSQRLAKDALQFVVSFPSAGKGDLGFEVMQESMQSNDQPGPHLYDSAMEYVQANVWAQANQHQSHVYYILSKKLDVSPGSGSEEEFRADAIADPRSDQSSAASANSHVLNYRPITYVHRRVAVPVFPAAPLLIPRTLLENVFDPLPLVQKVWTVETSQSHLTAVFKGYQRKRELVFNIE